MLKWKLATAILISQLTRFVRLCIVTSYAISGKRSATTGLPSTGFIRYSAGQNDQ